MPEVPVDEGTRPPVGVGMDFVTTCSLHPLPRAPVDECVKVETASWGVGVIGESIRAGGPGAPALGEIGRVGCSFIGNYGFRSTGMPIGAVVRLDDGVTASVPSAPAR